MLSTDGGGTHWFQAWHRTHPPAGPWPGTETGSGLCGSPWRTSACWSPQSHCLSAAQWTCHLQGGETAGEGSAAGNGQRNGGKMADSGRLLPIVSMVSLSSMRSWARGMSMCILSVCCCLFTVSGVLVFLLRR